MYEKVEKRFKHATGLEDTISKFNMLWISFNCYYRIKNGWYKTVNGKKKNKTDNDCIDELLWCTNCKCAFGNLEKDVFYKFINERKASCQGRLSSGGVYNLRDENKITYENKDTFGEYLGIIYTIRNNQFHGSKNPKDESDNQLLEQATQSFENFLKNLYETEGIIN